MRKTKYNAGYNARNPYMLVSLSRILRDSRLFLLILLQAGLLGATDWRKPEQELAGKIAAMTGPGAAALELTNRSSLSHADVDQIYRGLVTELATLGVRAVSPDQAEANLQISLSEDLRHYVWVAEIHQGVNETVVAMVSMPRPAATSRTAEEATMIVRKSLLWSQTSRILDVAVVSSIPPRLIILDSDNITIYASQGSHWQPEQALPVEHSHPWPRDLRGRLLLRKDHLFDAFLPGTVCRSSSAGAFAMHCFGTDDPWPLTTGISEQPALNAFFASTRNFFTGALSPGIGKQTATSAFFSAAPLPRDKYILWLFATVDGQFHFLDGLTDQNVPAVHWGSDIATIHSSCGSGWQVLATGNGESTSDTVQAYEVPDREPVAVSPPTQFSGNIVALWTSSQGNEVIAVSHNSVTGAYEAFLLSMACNQ
jgi:hypothetical protein